MKRTQMTVTRADRIAEIAREEAKYRATWDAHYRHTLEDIERHEQHDTKGVKMFPYVKLHQEGQQVAISTNAEHEHDFVSGAALALSSVSEVLTKKELGLWLPQIVDICCVMRGYKGPSVTQQRVLIAGRLNPRDDSVIAQSQGEEVTPTVGREA